MPRALNAEQSFVERFITQSGLEKNSFVADAFAGLAQAFGKLQAIKKEGAKIQRYSDGFVQSTVNNCITQLRFGIPTDYDTEVSPILYQDYPYHQGSYPVHYYALLAFVQGIDRGYIPGYQALQYKSTPTGDHRILTARVFLDVDDLDIGNLLADVIAEEGKGNPHAILRLDIPPLYNREIQVYEANNPLIKPMNQATAIQLACKAIKSLQFATLYFEKDDGKSAYLQV